MAGRRVATSMGSQADWATMKHAGETLDALGIGYEAKIISAHRTPERHHAFTKSAKAQGFKIIIAGAGGAAHLPGVTAALTTLPVFGVPVESKALSGIDSLFSIVQMPPGVPVGTLAIGRAGAINAALLAASVLALGDGEVAKRLEAWRQRQSEAVPEAPEDGKRSEEHTSELQSHLNLVCRLLLEKKKTNNTLRAEVRASAVAKQPPEPAPHILAPHAIRRALACDTADAPRCRTPSTSQRARSHRT